MTGLPDWSADRLEEAVHSGEPVLVDLRAEWCPQCGPQEAVVARLLPEFEDRVRIGSVDVGVHPRVAERFGISTLPALLVFRDGELVDTLVGFKRTPLVRSALQAALAGA